MLSWFDMKAHIQLTAKALGDYPGGVVVSEIGEEKTRFTNH
jgi:hypothetical protein